MKTLLHVTESTLQITALTGPVNSGKTVLLRKMMEELRHNYVPIIHINLGSISFNSVDTLITTLEARLNSWWKQFIKTSERFQLDTSTLGVDVKISAQPLHSSQCPVARLNDLLNTFALHLPSSTFWHCIPKPVFIIDEANELGALLT